jgi:hypothetical protein
MNQLNKGIQGLLISLIGLLVIDVVLLQALFAQVPPHPPGNLGPFIAAMITLGVISPILIHWKNEMGLISSFIFGCMNILAVGPQKYLVDPNAELVVPIIILGTILTVSLFFSIYLVWKNKLLDQIKDE